MTTKMMKQPVESCPADGWTILDAIANCCPSWQETKTTAPSGRFERTTLRLDGGLGSCFEELKIICALGELTGKARVGAPHHDVTALPADSWSALSFADLNDSRLKSPEGTIYYSVRLFLPEITPVRRRGRKSEKAWVKAWAKSHYPDGLTGNVAELLRGLSNDFGAENRRRRNEGIPTGRLKESTARKHLGFYQRHGYGADEL